MAFTQAQFENQARAYLDDNSHRVVDELTNFVIGGNGNRKAFTLSKGNILNSGSNLVQFDSNMAGYTTTGISSVDTVNGIVNFTTAPALSSSVPTSLFILYWYQEFANSDLDTFLDYGLMKLGVNRIEDSTDYQNVIQAQFNVVCLYAASQGNRNLSERYAKFVDMSAEGKSASKAKIPQMYLELAKEFEDMAEKERLALYGARQGRSTAVASTAKRFLPRTLRQMPMR